MFSEDNSNAVTVMTDVDSKSVSDSQASIDGAESSAIITDEMPIIRDSVENFTSDSDTWENHQLDASTSSSFCDEVSENGPVTPLNLFLDETGASSCSDGGTPMISSQGQSGQIWSDTSTNNVPEMSTTSGETDGEDHIMIETGSSTDLSIDDGEELTVPDVVPPDPEVLDVSSRESPILSIALPSTSDDSNVQEEDAPILNEGNFEYERPLTDSHLDADEVPLPTESNLTDTAVDQESLFDHASNNAVVTNEGVNAESLMEGNADDDDVTLMDADGETNNIFDKFRYTNGSTHAARPGEVHNNTTPISTMAPSRAAGQLHNLTMAMVSSLGSATTMPTTAARAPIKSAALWTPPVRQQPVVPTRPVKSTPLVNGHGLAATAPKRIDRPILPKPPPLTPQSSAAVDASPPVQLQPLRTGGTGYVTRMAPLCASAKQTPQLSTPTTAPRFLATAEYQPSKSSTPTQGSLIHLNNVVKEKDSSAAFVPAPAELKLPMPREGYVCEHCGVRFALKFSLEFHMNRRSVAIQAPCSLCHKTFTFFNKCAMSQHVKYHGRPINVTFKQLKSRPVSAQEFEQWLNSADKANPQTLLNYEKQHAKPSTQSTTGSSSITVDVSSADPGSNDSEVVVVAPTPVAFSQPSSRTCAECQESLPSVEALRAHFVYNLPPSQKQFICHVCQAVYFSRCSFNSHLRVHSNARPFTCAECGLVLSQFSELNLHTLTHRNTPTVLDAWRCGLCYTFYSAFDALSMHVAAAHCDSYVKCPLCPVAFRTTKAFEDHRNKQHKGNPAMGGKVLYKCYECSNVKYFQQKDHLLEHLREHMNKMQPFQVFRCAICGRLMENKSGLVAHFRSYHRLQISEQDIKEDKISVDRSGQAIVAGAPVSATGDPVPRQGVKRPLPSTVGVMQVNTPKLPRNVDPAQAPTPKKARYLCHLCKNNVHCRTEASYALHLKMFHSILIDKGPYHPRRAGDPPKCRRCQKVCPNDKELYTHGLQHLKEERALVCLLCDNLPQTTRDELAFHLSQHIAHVGASGFNCTKHCVPPRLFEDKPSAYNHLREMHQFAPLRCTQCATLMSSVRELNIHVKVCPKNASNFLKKPVNLLNTPPNFPPQQHVSAPEVDSSMSQGEDEENGDEECSSQDDADLSATTNSPETQAHNPGQNFRCAKCGLERSDRRKFTEHIQLHREARYYQCLECGLCFVNDISLFKHLRAMHKIVSVHMYLAQHKLAKPQPVQGDPNQTHFECDVCTRLFETQNALNAHQKTHGLRFLKGKLSE